MITFLSRRWLRERHSYGYYRFFVFEFILLLIVGNLRVWFDDPFSLLQILSWIALSASMYLVICGFNLIGLRKAADKDRSGQLIEKGIYGKIRHPLYSSLLFLAAGAYLKKPSLYSSMLIVGAVYSLMATVRAEEEIDLAKFGPSYEDYMRRTKRFIPYLF